MGVDAVDGRLYSHVDTRNPEMDERPQLVTKTMHPSTQAKELTRVGCDKTSDTNK